MPQKKTNKDNLPYIIAAILTLTILGFSYIKMAQIAEYNHQQTVKEAQKRLKDLQSGKVQEEETEEYTGE